MLCFKLITSFDTITNYYLSYNYKLLMKNGSRSYVVCRVLNRYLNYATPYRYCIGTQSVWGKRNSRWTVTNLTTSQHVDNRLKNSTIFASFTVHKTRCCIIILILMKTTPILILRLCMDVVYQLEIVNLKFKSFILTRGSCIHVGYNMLPDVALDFKRTSYGVRVWNVSH